MHTPTHDNTVKNTADTNNSVNGGISGFIVTA